MHWELWDAESGNIVNTYPTRESALGVVREAMRRHGRIYVQHWSLAPQEDTNDFGSVIDGDNLADEALRLPSA